MNTDFLAADIRMESAIRRETNKQKLQSHGILACEVLAWLACIAFLAGLFFALKLSVELGLRVVSHETTEHARMNHGF